MNHCIDCGIELNNIPESLDHLHIFRCIACFGHYEPIRPALSRSEKKRQREDAEDMEAAASNAV